MQKPRPTVIYVEDQPDHFSYIAPVIESRGFRVVHAKNHEELPGVLKTHPDAAAIVSDVDTITGGEGITWANSYRRQPGHKPFLLMSAMATYGDAAQEMGVAFLTKPVLAIIGEETPAGSIFQPGTFKERLSGWLADLPIENKRYSRNSCRPGFQQGMGR